MADPTPTPRTADETARLTCPECRVGKHVNCDGLTFDFDADKMVDCRCPICRSAELDVWTCRGCGTDHSTGSPIHGCPDCGHVQVGL